jgi:hypothetical protein
MMTVRVLRAMAILVCIACAGCALRPKASRVHIIIPRLCVTSDLDCWQVGQEMRCKFDKRTGCEIVKVK